MRSILVGLVVLAVGACDSADSQMDFLYHTDPVRDITRDLITVQFTHGSWTRSLTSGAFRERSRTAARTGYYSAGDHGQTYVKVILARGADTLVIGDATIDLEPQGRWTVDIFFVDSNPLSGCFGCFSSRGFQAAAGAPADSLFLIWYRQVNL